MNKIGFQGNSFFDDTEIVIGLPGKNNHFVFLSLVKTWLPYVYFPENHKFICMGSFCKKEDIKKWLDGEEVELLTA